MLPIASETNISQEPSITNPLMLYDEIDKVSCEQEIKLSDDLLINELIMASPRKNLLSGRHFRVNSSLFLGKELKNKKNVKPLFFSIKTCAS